MTICEKYFGTIEELHICVFMLYSLQMKRQLDDCSGFLLAEPNVFAVLDSQCVRGGHLYGGDKMRIIPESERKLIIVNLPSGGARQNGS